MIVECPGCAARYDLTGRPPHTRARCRCGTEFLLPEPPVHAGSLECPHCRAPVPPTASRCEYCGVTLAVRACPRCFAMIFLGHKHCAACGSEVAVPAQATRDGAAIPRTCPTCSGEQRLEGRLVAGCCLDECARCRGVFVDLPTLERVLAERQRIPVVEALGRPSPPIEAPATSPGPVYRKCPDCSTLMNRRNFGRNSGVIIDVCIAHGTWFDAEELPRVIAFVADGGVERAERRDLERQREEIRRERVSGRYTAPMAYAQPTDMNGAAWELGNILSAIADLLRK